MHQKDRQHGHLKVLALRLRMLVNIAYDPKCFDPRESGNPFLA